MAIFKEISPNEISTARSFLNQLVDVIQLDISGSTSRRKYQVFVTGGVGPGVTSSLFQTVFDQDFTLQTANPIFDITVGLYASSSIVTQSMTGQDSVGKLLFPSTSMMMREKIDIYRQFSQQLLGDANSQFIAPFNSTSASDLIDAPLFFCFKRLFHRDGIKRETFAMKFYQTASNALTALGTPNLNVTSETGATVYTDVGSSATRLVSFGGQVSNIVDAANTGRSVGLLFNDRGVLVLDSAKVMSGSQKVSGTIDAIAQLGSIRIGGDAQSGQNYGNRDAKFIPDFFVSASIDNIIDHVATTRFSSGTLTAFTFQNVTNINSTLFFCRAEADEFNYSANPTFKDSDDRIVVIDENQEDTQQTFTFVTSIALYDTNDNMLAVAKLSRPIEKSPERDLTFRVRLDF